MGSEPDKNWRAEASEQSQEDLDGLLDFALGFAQEQLSAHGEFFPYAAVADTSGQTKAITAGPDGVDGVDERPPSVDVIESCIAAITNQRDVTRACAVVADVRVPNIGSDAIQVELEHIDGHALTVLLPYKIKRLGRAIKYGELRAAPGQNRIWPQN